MPGKMIEKELSVEDLGELVGLTMWELFSCIWGKLIFLATRRPGDCTEMKLEYLRNPRCRLGIITVPTMVIKVDIVEVYLNSKIVKSLPDFEVKERVEIDTIDAHDLMGLCDPSHGITLVVA
eukprot:Gb_30375 [translate_table: standard]